MLLRGTIREMPLTPQEQHCIELALGTLGELYGGTWRVPDGPTLDDLHKSQVSPECLVTNDVINAAIEVKRLTGDSVWQAYKEALRSLNRSLVPFRVVRGVEAVAVRRFP